MSNTDTNQAGELFELCKKVYELTEWECDGEYVYHHNDLVNVVRGKPAGDYWENNWWFPIYTSDFLLKKLPEEVKKRVLVVTNGDRPHAGYAERDNYGNYTLDEYYWKNAQYSNEARKALLKLTIALSEAGELK